MKKSFLLLFLSLFVFLPTRAQTKEELDDAINRMDVVSLVKLSNNPTFETDVMDALCQSNSMQNMTYEELLNCRSITKPNSDINNFVTDLITAKEDEIRKQIIFLDLEQLMQYIGHFPERKEIVTSFLDKCLAPNLKSLSYLELVYLSTVMPNFKREIIGQEIKSRFQEKRALMVKNVDKFATGEKFFIDQIKYVTEQIIWAYFIESHKKLTEAYGKISMVSDDAYEAAYQYECLVRACFSPLVLHDLVQQEINQYCGQVNQARKEYATMANKKSYQMASYSVPFIQINSVSPTIAPLFSIRENRLQYLEGREDINSGSGIIGWIFGGIAGVVAKGIGDWMAISGLVDCEYKARYKYVKAFHEQLLNNFVEYSNLVTSDLETSLLKNQKEYAKSIKR